MTNRLRPKDGGQNTAGDDGGNTNVDFSGEQRGDETHALTTDPEALLARKGQGWEEAKPCFVGSFGSLWGDKKEASRGDLHFGGEPM